MQGAGAAGGGVERVERVERRDLNKATYDDLFRIPGFDESLCTYVVQAMPFRSWEEVLLVKGIGTKRHALLRQHFRVTTPVVVVPHEASDTHDWVSAAYCHSCGCRVRTSAARAVCPIVHELKLLTDKLAEL